MFFNFLPLPILSAYTYTRLLGSEKKRHYLTYRIVFVVNFLVCYLIMKVISIMMNPVERKVMISFFYSPYLSPRSLSFKGTDSFSSIVVTLILSSALTGIFVVTGRLILSPLHYTDILLIAPVIFFMTEAVGALGQLLFYGFCPRSFPIHHHPLSSRNLGQFWGRHWNLWVQDWLKDVSRPFRGRKIKRLLAIFFISGFFHEAMVNLPYWLVYKKSYFGTMLAYFMIQALGLKLEKTFLRGKSPFVQRLFMFLVVFLPSPLFVNVPLLTFLGFMHG